MREIKFLLVALLVILSGCRGSEAKSPVLPVMTAYEAARTVWLWADATLDSEHRTASDMALDAVKTIVPDLKEQCGENWRSCGMQAWESMVEDWEKTHDYKLRAESVERARQMLEVWYSSIKTEGPDMTRRATEATSALLVIIAELEARGVDVPPELKSALAIIRILAEDKGISRAAPPAYGNRVVTTEGQEVEL